MKSEEKFIMTEGMADMVLELQRAASDTSIKVSDLLLKAWVVATKLNVISQESWIEHELHGYLDINENYDLIPKYRFLKSKLDYEIISSSGIEYLDPFTLKINPSDPHKNTEEFPCHVSIPEIERTLEYETKNNFVHIPLQPDIERYYKEDLEILHPVNPIMLTLQASTFSGILDAVRTKILDWTLNLEKKGIISEDPPAQTGGRDETIWDVHGDPRKKLTIIRDGYIGEFVVWDYEEISVPHWANKRVDDHEANLYVAKWPGISYSPGDSVFACRFWLQEGPPKPYSKAPDVSDNMCIVEVVYSGLFFVQLYTVGGIFVAFSNFQGEREEYHLIAYQPPEPMTDEQKLSKGYPVEGQNAIQEPCGTKLLPKAKRPYKLWTIPARKSVALLYNSYRADNPSARLEDCYDMYKKTPRLHESITSFKDFKKCWDSAKKAESVRKKERLKEKNARK